MVTISDVDLQKAWLDIYSATGITFGTAVDIQNKGSDMVFVQVKGSAPAADNRDGYVILPYENLQIGAGEVGLWAYHGKRWGRIAERFIDALFGKGHCFNSIEWDEVNKPQFKIWK